MQGRGRGKPLPQGILGKEGLDGRCGALNHRSPKGWWDLEHAWHPCKQGAADLKADASAADPFEIAYYERICGRRILVQHWSEGSW